MNPKILVVGDLILDHYVWGECQRISPEAPVQVVSVNKETLSLGGACNVANNLISLGADVFICGMIGDDDAGAKLKDRLESLNINTSGIYTNKNRPTTQKSRIIASNQQVIRVDKEDKSQISNDGEKFILDFATTMIDKIDCIVLSDYQKGVLSTKLTQSLIQLAKQKNLKILIDPKGHDYSKYKDSTLLTPNKKEAIEATGINIIDDESLLQALEKLKNTCNLEYSLITLSEDGIAILQDSKLIKVPTIAREVFDVTGAGDTVIASLAFMLSQKEEILPSIYFANAAAAVVVSKVGSVAANKKDIFTYLYDNYLLDSSLVSTKFMEAFSQDGAKFLSNFHKIVQRKKPINPQNKLITKDDFDNFLESLTKLTNLKIVFTNGCFDILHIGHISYLNEAKKLGDVLIVGLNSNSSIKAIKGNDRPINNELDRAYMLCALECIDFVIIFDEETPFNLIKQIKPNILVKGGDYKNKEVVGAEFANEVKLIDFIEGKSTTNIINKIKGNQ